MPSAITLNPANVLAALSSGASRGSATATSPLYPSSLSGNLTLTGGAATPEIAVTFPAPLSLTLQGPVDPANNTITFANQPDIPFSTLAINVNGGTSGMFETTCSPSSGTLAGSFTGQNGTTSTSSPSVTIANCPTLTTTPPPKAGAPTLTGFLSGLASGRPKLRVTAVRGDNGAPDISSLAIGVPHGLSFNSKAFVTNTVCKGKGAKRRCTTTAAIKGLSVSHGTPKTAKLTAGKLLISLTKPVASVTVTASGPLLTETTALRAKVKNKKLSTIPFSFRITDAKETSTTLTLALKPGPTGPRSRISDTKQHPRSPPTFAG